MGDIAVRVENLSKLYRIGAKQEGYKTFRDSITDALTAPFKRVAGLLRGNAAAAANLNETIWALKDVSFEVKKGEVVGIIGRNGAGKSTLLKILSRITEPTSGEAKVYGRVGALLEVGTGFHPELTGRENIYLNGAILGMSREEIKRKFDEIVAFAEVEKFIDTPVKHYSSGMGLRLGFAVAAHLEPEILIVDEVLAVGDAAFQKKCLGKMSEVAGEGRTVLFVSHNMAAVESLCQRVYVLENGSLMFTGDVLKGLSYYVSAGVISQDSVDMLNHQDRRSAMTPVLARLRVSADSGLGTTSFRLGETVVFTVDIDPGTAVYAFASVNIGLYNHIGQLICKMKSNIQFTEELRISSRDSISCHLEDIRLVPGEYTVAVSFTNGKDVIDWVDKITSIQVLASDIYGTGQTERMNTGYIVPRVTWGRAEEVAKSR